MNDLTSIDWSRVPDEYKEELLELLSAREEWLKYNKLDSFEPYEFQKRFYKASNDYRFRFLCAANR